MRLIQLGLLTAFLTTAAYGGDSALPFSEQAGCNEGELAQFGQYVGDWKIEDSARSRETGEWQPGKGARWIFSCLGNGTAIQDFWMPNGGEVGTNLRAYNSESESWDIVWAIKSVVGFAHITAKQNAAGEIVMKHVSPIPNPIRKITFYPVNEDGWNWKLEISSDEGENWTEVYRIKATRYEP